MELFVISSPIAVPSEGKIINRLFELGLNYFHLRKPDSCPKELTNIWQSIAPEFRNKIAWHQEHGLALELGTKRLHFSESKRRSTAHNALKELRLQGFILSTSIHKPADIEEIPVFEYAFLGPVFDSISKPGYKRAIPEDFSLPKHLYKNKIIALGGITPVKIPRISKMHFDGAALLGAIWNQPSEPTPELAAQSFLEIKNAIQNTLTH